MWQLDAEPRIEHTQGRVDGMAAGSTTVISVYCQSKQFDTDEPWPRFHMYHYILYFRCDHFSPFKQDFLYVVSTVVVLIIASYFL